MGLLDVFKKKESVAVPAFPEPAPSGPPTDVPVESVLIMRQQGLTNPQIIQALQRQGYQLQLVAEALRQSEVRPGIEPVASEVAPEQSAQQQEAPKVGSEVSSEVQKSVLSAWEAVKVLQSWQSGVDDRLGELDKKVDALSSELKTVHQAVFAQIQEYNKTLKGVGTEIIAMEKVFSEALPDLTSSIQDLQRVTGKIKGEPEKKAGKKAV